MSLIGHDLTQLQNWSLKKVLSVLTYNIPRRSRYEIIQQNFKEPSRVPVRHLEGEYVRHLFKLKIIQFSGFYENLIISIGDYLTIGHIFNDPS